MEDLIMGAVLLVIVYSAYMFLKRNEQHSLYIS